MDKQFKLGWRIWKCSRTDETIKCSVPYALRPRTFQKSWINPNTSLPRSFGSFITHWNQLFSLLGAGDLDRLCTWNTSTWWVLPQRSFNKPLICCISWHSLVKEPVPTFHKDLQGIQLMSYEPGSGECRVLISSKEQLETMLLNLGKLEGTAEILQQLRDVHGQLELLHDQRRSESN